jgi:hypothetical protein
VFKRARITILLLVLAYVGVSAFTARARIASWERPVRVAVFTIAADDSPATRAHLESVDANAFSGVAAFFTEEAARHGLPLAVPVEVRHAGRMEAMPPPAPVNGSRLDAMLWSLRLRWWVWRHAGDVSPAPQVRLFVLHHDPARVSTVPHSVGLSKGLVGVVHVFAHRAQASQNDIVLAHELLHTLGADDKYDPAANQPLFPDGYAEPGREPRHPQRFAEIMAGRTPLSASESEMPASLADVLIGERTAAEIGWAKTH